MTEGVCLLRGGTLQPLGKEVQLLGGPKERQISTPYVFLSGGTVEPSSAIICPVTFSKSSLCSLIFHIMLV